MDTRKLITPAELDRILRYPRGRSLRLARRGLLPAIKLPDGEWRFTESAVAEIMGDKSDPIGGDHDRK